MAKMIPDIPDSSIENQGECPDRILCAKGHDHYDHGGELFIGGSNNGS